MAEPACRQCGASALRLHGPIPRGERFAGQPLDPGWDPGQLYECRRCGLGMRWPLRPDADYERLYQRASDTVWVDGALRRDQRLVRERIHAAARPGSVLDVGCYDGALLASLAPGWQRFGVEASRLAAQAARGKGIEILAERIADIAAIARRFDVITAVDVIEHVADPKAFVAMLADRLVPGGRLILSTGSLDAPAWRWAGGGYWYCTIPEHLSFISPGWAAAVAGELGLALTDVQRFQYRDDIAPDLLRARLRFFREVGASRLKAWLAARWPALLGHRLKCYSFGHPGLFADHVVLTLGRPVAAGGG